MLFILLCNTEILKVTFASKKMLFRQKITHFAESMII